MRSTAANCVPLPIRKARPIPVARVYSSAARIGYPDRSHATWFHHGVSLP
jgi:hypothetical protein